MSVLFPIPGPGFLPTADMVNHPDPAVRASQVANLRAMLTWVEGFLNQLVASGNVLELGDDITSETTYGQTSDSGVSLFASRDDHTHGTPPLSNALPEPVAATAYAGVGLTPSRHDHWHSISIIQEVPAGTIDGVNDTFTLTQTPYLLLLNLNGQFLMPGGRDYTLTGNSIQYVPGKIPQPATSDHSADQHFAVGFY